MRFLYLAQYSNVTFYSAEPHKLVPIKKMGTKLNYPQRECFQSMLVTMISVIYSQVNPTLACLN